MVAQWPCTVLTCEQPGSWSSRLKKKKPSVQVFRSVPERLALLEMMSLVCHFMPSPWLSYDLLSVQTPGWELTPRLIFHLDPASACLLTAARTCCNTGSTTHRQRSSSSFSGKSPAYQFISNFGQKSDQVCQLLCQELDRQAPQRLRHKNKRQCFLPLTEKFPELCIVALHWPSRGREEQSCRSCDRKNCILFSCDRSPHDQILNPSGVGTRLVTW